MDIFERIIIAIVGSMCIIISFFIGLNQNRNEKEYYKKQYEYYKTLVENLVVHGCNSNENQF